MRILVTAGVLVMLSVPAWGQQPARDGRGGGAAQPPATDATKATKYSGAALEAAIAKLPKDRPNGVTQIFRLVGDKPYTVSVEHRTNMPQAAAVHDTEAELFYVIDGSATMMTGGKLVGETRNGANLSGKSIEGGTANKLTKGDFLMVPEGVPHWFSQIDGTALTIMSFHLPRK
jgi:mannose-6-phosphate isomerase-like protein (cupin superfamily)